METLDEQFKPVSWKKDNLFSATDIGKILLIVQNIFFGKILLIFLEISRNESRKLAKFCFAASINGNPSRGIHAC